MLLEVFGIIGACGATAVGGYVLAHHMHSIANAAAQRAVSTIAHTVGATATLQPKAPSVSGLAPQSDPAKEGH